MANQYTDQMKDLQAKAAADPHRPRYHFLPPCWMMGDPDGLLFHNDQYHLFYISQSSLKPGTPQHWAHVTSTDLVHWTHLPIAFASTPGSCDEGGLRTGSAAQDDDRVAILYAGADFPKRTREWREVICLATSTDGMLTWKKDPSNPVVTPPPGLDVTGFRDPCFWKEADMWHMLVGSGVQDKGGTALLYRSKDLVEWEYMHPLCEEYDATNRYWECPDFFPLGGKHVLLVSKTSPHLWYSSTILARSLLATFYAVGTYKNHRFSVEGEGNTDAGGYFYAAKTLVDGQGRRIIWGWVWEGRYAWEGRPAEVAQAQGWAGVLSLPRILSLGHDGTLRFEPPAELAVLRERERRCAGVEIAGDSVIPLEGFEGECIEIEAEIDPKDTEECGIVVRRSPDGAEETRITYIARDGRLVIERERSSMDGTTDRFMRGGRLALSGDEPLRLRIFLDRSVLEVFANDRMCLTSRIYPTRKDSVGVAVFAEGGNARVVSMTAWDMRSIWGRDE